MNWEHHRRAQDCIAQSYLTNSKRPEALVKGVFPTHIKRGQGAFLWDHQGKKYLDFICGLGTNLIGYGHSKVNAAISAQLAHGYSHSLATHLELEAAEKLKELFPFVDAVKWTKTGSDACSAAVRIARAKTGRNVVLSEGYHGTDDQFVALTPPAIGIPPRDWVGVLDLNHDLDCIAAIIIEPVITDASPERLAWLQMIRELCTKRGVMLIFDEIITGFRFPKYSVASYCGVTPDLICLGKAIAGGMPLACVGGKYDVMNCGEYFISSTYAGETLSLAAAKEVMTLLQTTYDITWLWANGKSFQDEFNSLWPEQLTIEGYPSRGTFKGDPMVKALFWQEACKAGMLFGPSWWMSFPLAEESKNAMVSIRAIMQRIKRGEVKLEGELPQAPFAQKAREG